MGLNLGHVFTINPDGSGKVALKWDGPAAGVDPDAFVRSEIANAQGVEAWSGVAATVDDGRLIFEATVYFRALEGLRFHCQGFHVNALDFKTVTDEKGNLVLESSAAPSTAAPVTGSDKELRARIKEERGKFETFKPMLTELFGGLDCSATIEMPGKIGTVSGAKKSGDRSALAVFKGAAIIALLERLMTDDDLAIKFVRAGADPGALAALADGVGPITIVTKGKLAPAFDYETEATQAKANFEELRKAVSAPPERVAGPPMQNIRVVASKVVREADSNRELTPMGQNYASMSLVIAGELPVAAMSLDEARIESAITDAGEQLAPEDEWQRRISFPRLTKDKATAFFEVELKPTNDVAGFKELRGSVKAIVAGSKEEIDLGFKKLAPGEEGKALGATLMSVEEEGEGHCFTFSLAVPQSAVEEVLVMNAKGERLSSGQRGYSSSGDQCELTYVVDEKLPPKGKIVVRVATDLRPVDVSFAIENIDATGRRRT